MDEETETILKAAGNLPEHDGRGMDLLTAIRSADQIHTLFMDHSGKIWKDTFDLQQAREMAWRKQYTTGTATAGTFHSCVRYVGRNTDQRKWRRRANGLIATG